LRLVLRSATICNVVRPKIAAFLRPSIFRSKFNVALGIEAQGFCIVR
jgi:hypothetical protein